MRARLLCALIVASVVSPAGATARAPDSTAAGSTTADAAKAPDVDPSSVCEADAEAAATADDDAHLNDEAAEAAPSVADLVLANRQVQTMIGLFGRGLTVNEDAVEPPLAPVSVRLRPAKRVGASLAVFVRF
jgi:hypothetical protein